MGVDHKFQHYRDNIRELQAGPREKSGGGWFS